MKLVLLSGGSGKRLWPLSNDSRSKQFLKVMENENGQLESMVQRVWGQLKRVGLDHHSIIATSASQVDMIHSQLAADIPLIIEPKRRDTFPAIALAATYLYSVSKTGLDEVVAVLPVDPYVADSFYETVLRLETAIADTNAHLALIGVEPTYPSSKYGYIIPKPSSEVKQGPHYVQSFKEKPAEVEAEKLIEQGALWNCGVFAFRLGYLIQLLLEKGLPIQYQELLQKYGELPKISFDYEVVEKTPEIVVIPYAGGWKDLGTWNTLTEEMATSVIGKGIVSSESTNTHVINELDIPVAVLGLSNIVVATSPDGILVAEKSMSPHIKELMVDLEQRPMYEERRWGWYRVIDFTKIDDEQEVLTKRICIYEGKNLSYQVHHKRKEVWTIIKGEGLFAMNDQMIQVKAGDVLQIPQGERHAIKAIKEMEIIEVQTGSELIEEDIIRICLRWDEIEQFCAYARAQYQS